MEIMKMIRYLLKLFSEQTTRQISNINHESVTITSKKFMTKGRLSAICRKIPFRYNSVVT